jgi:hypothetical protein
LPRKYSISRGLFHRLTYAFAGPHITHHTSQNSTLLHPRTSSFCTPCIENRPITINLGALFLHDPSRGPEGHLEALCQIVSALATDTSLRAAQGRGRGWVGAGTEVEAPVTVRLLDRIEAGATVGVRALLSTHKEAQRFEPTSLQRFDTQTIESDAKKNNEQIVVEKLTKNVTEPHILEIFGSFGEIQSVDLPMNHTCMPMHLFLLSSANMPIGSYGKQGYGVYSLPRSRRRRSRHCTYA